MQRSTDTEYGVFEGSTGRLIGEIRRTKSKFLSFGWDIVDEHNQELAVIEKTMNLNSFFTKISSLFDLNGLPVIPKYFRQNFVIKSKDKDKDKVIANLLSKRGHFWGEISVKFDSNIVDGDLSYLILATTLLAFDQIGPYDVEVI